MGIIPSAGVFRLTIIDKSWPIKSIGSRLRDYTRTFNSDVRARSTSRRTSPAEGIEKYIYNITVARIGFLNKI